MRYDEVECVLRGRASETRGSMTPDHSESGLVMGPFYDLECILGEVVGSRAGVGRLGGAYMVVYMRLAGRVRVVCCSAFLLPNNAAFSRRVSDMGLCGLGARRTGKLVGAGTKRATRRVAFNESTRLIKWHF